MSIEGIVVGLLAVVVGAAWAAYGLKFFTILLPLWAFLFGLIGGAQWGQDVFGEGFFSTVLSWIIGFGFGLFLAVISFFWYYAAVTIMGGALGYALGVGLMDWLNIDAQILGILVGLIVGAVFAFATFALGVPAFLVIYLSAISGAAAVVNGVLLIFNVIKLDDIESGFFNGLLTNGVVAIIAWIVLSVVAIMYQLRDVGRMAASIDRSAYRY
jgi:Domain of unknown function (DUF4203)